MGFFVNEKQFINDNVFQFEKRMDSQYSRFLDKAPNFVTYYNINNIESTSDNGFQNIERVLGVDSPLRYQEVKDLPIYGLEQILLDISDEEQGLDTNYDGEAIILPNTIKPLPNDFFKINYLDQNYLFMVTAISYDTIKSNNYYKISFTLKSLTADNANALSEQTTEKYGCILENIGTQEKCIIENDQIKLIIALNDIYTNVIQRYKMLFYDDKYNSFLFRSDDGIIYDKYLSHFINNNRLFNEKFNYQSLLLNNEDYSNMFTYEYETSIYRNIEMCRKDLLNQVNYSASSILNITSIFNFYRDSSIKSVSFKYGNSPYIDSSLIDRIKSGVPLNDEPILEKTLIGFFNNTIESIYGIDLEGMKNYDFISYDFKSFILIPILLFIMRSYYNKFMSIK